MQLGKTSRPRALRGLTVLPPAAAPPAPRCPCVGGSCPTGLGTPPPSCGGDTATGLALGGWAALGPPPLHLPGLALPGVHIGEQTLHPPRG